MTAVVVGGSKGKEYRLPTDYESAVAMPTEEQVQAAFEGVPFGQCPMSEPRARAALGMRVPLYGLRSVAEAVHPTSAYGVGQIRPRDAGCS